MGAGARGLSIQQKGAKIDMSCPDRRFVPGDLQGGAAWFKNWNEQMQAIGSTLGFSAPELARIQDDYDMIDFIANTATKVDAYDGAVRSHRRVTLYGNVGDPTPAFPANVSITPATAVPTGLWERNNEDIGRVRKAPAYTEETGSLLGIIPITPEAPDPNNTAPDLDVTTEPNYKIKIDGVMRGFDAIRFEYQRNGTTGWPLVAVLTKLKGEITITPATPGQPEAGRIRAIYLDGNEEFGQYSPEYPVTLS
jgi:hypothetical protein